jgi:heme O synthase-like polyprenyltransferase
MAQTRIIIVGGGFGGLAAAKALRNTPAEIILIDRTNHHLSLVVSLALIPLSLIPTITGKSGLAYFVGAFILGSIFFYCGARFAFRRSNVAARHLLAASIVYLPAVFVLMMLNKK